jgi:hypothetical protein
MSSEFNNPGISGFDWGAFGTSRFEVDSTTKGVARLFTRLVVDAECLLTFPGDGPLTDPGRMGG